MVALRSVYAESTADHEHTGDLLFVDILTMPAASFIANADYIFWVTAQIGLDTVSRLAEMRVVHGPGDTVFPTSLFTFEPASSVETRRHTYGWQFRFTMPAITEDVTFQMRLVGSSGDIVRASGVTMFAFETAQLVEGVDFIHGVEDDIAAPVAHTTTYVNFASITFTPAVPGDYLVVAMQQVLINNGSVECEARINRDADTEVAPEFLEEGENLAEQKNRWLIRPYNLSAAPHTFTLQGRDSGVTTQNDHNFSNITAIRLDVFEAHGIFWDEAAQTFTTDAVFDSINDFPSYTPVTAADHVMIAYAGGDLAGGERSSIRFQVDGVTAPLNKDVASDALEYDGFDINPNHALALVNLDVTPHDIHFDGRVSSVPDTFIEDRAAVYFSLELAAGPPEPPPVGRTKGVTRRRQTALVAAQRDDPDGNPTEQYLLLRTDEFGQVRTVP